MLLNLSIQNFAVFEKESINFEKGFNVFTGETGSGKSVLIEAISLILGERATKDIIRKGQKSALVEGVFDISSNEALTNFLYSNNIYLDENDFLIISRQISENGKTINKINGRLVPLSVIKDTGKFLIDIYGQFGHENIFKKENHITLLDSIVRRDISDILVKYQNLYKEYIKKVDSIKFLEKKLENKNLKVEQIEYELEEIESASLKENEEEELLLEMKKLSNMQEIKNSMYEVDSLINNGKNGRQSSLENLNNAYSILSKMKNYDVNLEHLLKKMDLLIEQTQDLIYDIVDYSDELIFDEEMFQIIEERLSLINRLKRKYGFSLDKIEEYSNSLKDELKILIEAEYNLNILIDEKNSLYNSLVDYSQKLTSLRKKASIYLEENILKELNELNMENIRFKVNITKKDDFSYDGCDQIEFLISTNLGSDLNSIEKVVSGGEASRIMLAFKKLVSDIDNMTTMIFDEIDTGISGKTSQMAGVKMNYISNKHQVICITHSPQIASISKNHFFIEKKVTNDNTYSIVKKLDDNEKIYEIARLLSGMIITDKSLNNARELIDFSKEILE